MAWSAVASAVTRIGNLLTDEAIYLWGVEEQVVRLQRELRWMQSFLIEADAKKAEDERVQLWVSEIRDLAYDAEDVVETFALKIASKGTGGFSNRIKRYACILKEGWMLHKTRSNIEAIIARITDLTRQLQTYGIKELRVGEGSSSSNERRESRRPYPHIIDDNIVGLDDGIKQLVSVLVDDKSGCRVVSICGMGGLGKTTLAKKIYQRSQVIGHFNQLAWVYVSQQCQKRRVWEDILSSLTSINERDSKKSDEELARKLFDFMKDKKCLVILDDIWSIEAWDNIKPAFPESGTSSKILLTSRNKEIVSCADRRGYLYELQCLKDDESWELFQKIAFPGRDSTDYRVDARMEELGKDMLKHCAGLPLAIIVLGGILVTKFSYSEWIKVHENVKSQFKRREGQGVEEVLALSYEELPPYLKQCFLSLSHFPEDYEIPAKRLIQLWVAEGFISLSQNEINEGVIEEDEAERYLFQLVERCIIQIVKRDATLRIKTCRMHDLMRDLCLSKAKKEIPLCIIDHRNVDQSGNKFSLSTLDHSARGVVTNGFLCIKCIRNPCLRSAFFFIDISPHGLLANSSPKKLLNYVISHFITNHCILCDNPKMLAPILSELWGIWTYIFKNFKLLRVLDFEEGGDYAGCHLPSDIGNLIHLRFLSLRGVWFRSSKLPSSLGNLRCLQTLDLRIWGTIVCVPNVIWRMEQLRHLYLPLLCTGKTRLKLGTLRKLQTLVNFDTRDCYVKDLFNMTNLRKLKILWRFNIEDFKEDVDNSPILGSKCLRSLTIRCPSILGHYFYNTIDPNLAHLLSSCVCICKLSLDVNIRKLPEFHHFSQDITYIYLSCTNLDEDPMPTIEKLPNLRVLKLGNESFSGKKMTCSALGFPRLHSLSLRKLQNLEELKVDEGTMPTLRCLEIAVCRNMKIVPDGLSFITTLQELKIESMPKAFKDKLVEGGEDFYKVRHVPSIIFQKC